GPRSGPERVRLCDPSHDATRGRAWSECEPHNAAARQGRRRRRRDARNLHGGTEPALRYGAIGRHLLCRQHRRRGGFPYVTGADRITALGRKIANFKPSGHWTRSLLPSPDGQKLYAGVGSFSNIAETGMAVEEGRAVVYELDLASGEARIFASGLRN